MVKRLDKQLIPDMISLYNSGINCTELSNKFGISIPAVMGLLKRRGVILRSQSELQRKYAMDENFFSTIDTQDKAYFLGLLFADGSINKRTVALALQERDRHILESFANLIYKCERPLHTINPKSDKHSKQYTLQITSDKVISDLNKYGMTNNKTNTIAYPIGLPSEFDRHFIRGYFDGNGHVLSSDSEARFGISGSSKICFGIAEKIKLRLPKINPTINLGKPKKNLISSVLTVSKKSHIILLREWIYLDSNLFLFRKKEKMDSVRYVKYFPITS